MVLNRDSVSLTLTKGQERALKLARWLTKAHKSDGKPVVGIWRGYAGTGKTTCVRRIIEDLGRPVLLAPTGKAALRLMETTGHKASTLHRWLYQTTEHPTTGELIFDMKPLGDLDLPDNRLLVVDEASMVGRELWADLVEAATYSGCNILLVGDHFQLPPVEPNETDPFSVLTDSFPNDARQDLTEIVRQALDSPIIRASLALREGDVGTVERTLRSLDDKEAVWEFVRPFYERAGEGAVLCWTNRMRHAINASTRARLGFKPETLHRGEPLLVLRNAYEAEVYNGEVITFEGFKAVGEPVTVENSFPPHQTAKAAFGSTRVNECDVVLSPEGVSGKLQGFARKALAFAAMESLGGKFPKAPPPRMTKTGKVQRSFVPVLEANYGYTLTVHKSQGSEWNNVLVVIEDSMPLGSDDGRRWLYTAITRCKKEAVLRWM